MSTRAPKGEQIMTHRKAVTFAFTGMLSLAVLASLTTVAFAQSVKVEGIIKARSGNTMTLQTSDSPKLVVVLNDTTNVAQVQGALKARRKEMSMAALIPGLPVQVEGTYDAQN